MDGANLEDQLLKVPELPPGKLFHIFFSYAEYDRDFTCRLIDKLEKEFKLKCCEHTRDFTPGWSVIDNIKHCVMSSLKTVLIVSTESVKSQWCSYESEMTLHLSMDMRKKILIPMIIDDCTIPDHLKPLTYIDARGDAAQWWPKLLRAIESQAEVPMFESGLPVLSSEPFSFNPHYSNLDTIVNLKSKHRSCMHEEIRPYTVPCSLCRKGIQVPHVVFEEQMNILNRSTLFKYHFCFYERIGWIVCLILLWIFLIGMSFALNMDGLCSAWSSCFIYNLSAQLVSITILVVFIFFWFMRRKDYTQSRLQKTMKSSTTSHRLQVTSETTSNSEGILADDTSDQTPLLKDPSENLLTSCKKKNENSNEGLEQISKDILLRYSAKYLSLFLDEMLPRPEPPRHAAQVVCLCQYVENIEHFQPRSDQSRNIIEV